MKEKDYSIGEVLQPDGRYAMYYEGGEKILLSPNEELVKVLKTWHPAKCSANNISQQSGAGNSIKAVECLASQNIGLVYMIRRTFFIAETEINAVI